MAVFIVLWPYLLTTKLKSVIRHNLGQSSEYVVPHVYEGRKWLEGCDIINFPVILLYHYVQISLLLDRIYSVCIDSRLFRNKKRTKMKRKCE